MLSKIEITIDFNGHEDQPLLFKYSKTNGESFSNFTELFVLSLLTICITVYFIPPSEYSNLNITIFVIYSTNFLFENRKITNAVNFYNIDIAISRKFSVSKKTSNRSWTGICFNVYFELYSQPYLVTIKL